MLQRFFGWLTLALGAAVVATLAEEIHYQSDSQIIFPGPISKAGRSTASDNELVRSLELARRISMIRSDEEFFKLVNVTPSELSYSVSLTDRFGGVERSSAIKASAAICMPELQVVPVKENPDPAAIYFPNCIRIKRCGGCCNHELLSCQPAAIEIRNYQIHVTKLEEDLGQYNVFTEIVPLEEHTACRCDCKLKKEDCNDKHFYNQKECRCICKSLDEEDKCRQQNENKFWNASNCSCQCRRIEECSTGFFFDQNICSCKNLPISRHWINDEQKIGYNFRQFSKSNESPPVIVTLDATDARRNHKEDPEFK